MSDKTGIEWTDATWNPIRFSGPGLAYKGLVRFGASEATSTVPQGWNGEIEFVESALLQPLRWKRGRRIFVNSMSDLFHPGVTDEMLDRIFAVMALCPQHTFQVLTKRPERMGEYLKAHGIKSPGSREMCHELVQHCSGWQDTRKWMCFAANAFDVWPLPNVWLGVSVENQKAADERIPLLLQTPAVVRFLSCEPLLGPVSLRWFGGQAPHPRRVRQMPDVFRDGKLLAGCCDEYDGLRMLDWVIAGGESGKGPDIRPSHPDWFRSLRDQCAAAGVPFFFKQWGEFVEVDEEESDRNPEKTWVVGAEQIPGTLHSTGGAFMQRVGKKAAGDLLDGVRHHAFPEVQP